jgi:acetoin utilization deacetylase AcuC-like enzyme/GNAT superfamily N-acetyltransferase
MIRIRRISNPYLETNLRSLEKVKEIIRSQFPLVPVRKIDKIENQMVDPLGYQYQTSLFIAEGVNDAIRGLVVLSYMSDLQFCFLDYIAVDAEKTSSGIGGALYERVREEANSLDAFGIFFECLPDDPELCHGAEEILVQNRKRLAFYERFGARPLANTKYETKVEPDDDCAPYLVFDGLGRNDSIPTDRAREIVKAILDRKYGDYCPQSYIDMVIGSIQDDPVILRNPLYAKKMTRSSLSGLTAEKNKILLMVNDRHSIHHIRERGYVESPVRVSSILKELVKTGLFRDGKPARYPEKLILEVHDPQYVRYFKNVCRNLPKGKSVYPYVFPLRNAVRAPRELSVRAGYYCFDTFTPLNQNAFQAARWGVNCTLTATDAIIAGTRSAYVLTRPPGHHTERAAFGGFCYFNNCAIAANRFSKLGKVAILDIDFHHGNGQQQIFYHRNDVLTLSIHGHPSFAYPYFTGFQDEKGENEGLGFNFNFPLEEKTSYTYYLQTLTTALKIIREFHPQYLVVALGLDTAKGDPTGTWSFTSDNFRTTGKSVGNLQLPTLIVQEGGYKTQSLGTNARNFFSGFHESLYPSGHPDH